jgi:hypothetical protein
MSSETKLENENIHVMINHSDIKKLLFDTQLIFHTQVR